jgi:hypothetical protein
VQNNEEVVILRPDGDDAPGNTIQVVIVGCATHYSKAYYVDNKAGCNKSEPTCFSNDGRNPAPQSADPHAIKCSDCLHYVSGFRNDGKDNACYNSLDLALAMTDKLSAPMLLRVPPNSLKALTEYAAEFARRDIHLKSVVTEIKLVGSKSNPRLKFSKMRCVSKEIFDQVLAVAKSQTVQQIIGAMIVSSGSSAITGTSKNLNP